MGLIRVEDQFVYDPAVFAVRDSYCIIWDTMDKGMGWVTINGERYTDFNNGNINSESKIHKVFVPMAELDKACEYEVTFVRVVDRLPYFAKSGETQTKTFKFKPIKPGQKINAYQICDSHSLHRQPAAAAEYFGDDLDLLIFNGDIPNHSGSIEHLLSIHKIASAVTHGEIPIVYARGNHDTRGEVALEFDKFIGTDNGNMYFTFRLGDLWGIVLDCGEDKDDDHPEYGGMADFKRYRKDQLKFLDSVIKNKANEYEAEGVKYKICVVHMRLNIGHNAHSLEIYKDWIRALNEMKIDLALHGHEHRHYFVDTNPETEFGKIEFPFALGGSAKGTVTKPDGKVDKDFIGTAVVFDNDTIDIKFTNTEKKIFGEHTVKIKR